MAITVTEDIFYFEDEIGDDYEGDPPLVLRDRIHWIQEGDTLYDVSTIYYGTADNIDAIIAANSDLISNPDLIYSGDRLVIPDATYPLHYKVRERDTLYHLARRFYGDISCVDLLFNSNRDLIRDPDLIFAGQTLVIL
ncbi:MAG: hypothetical protein RLZZ274_210 [Cyanobacteriota bacterium]|jgi:nucleoid-associated protein YgaU